MRFDRAIDRFLSWRQLERDAPQGSIDKYFSILNRVSDDWPHARLHDFEGRQGSDKLRFTIGRQWGTCASSTRANVISVVHSFFDWAEAEDLIESNPARRLRRPPVRKPDIRRPTDDHLAAIRAAALPWEKPAILLLEGVGLRVSEVCRLRWRDLDLKRGRVRVLRKGGKRQVVVILPDVLRELRACEETIRPDEDWHVFVVKQKRWLRAEHRSETIRNPLQQAGRNSLWHLVDRVCERAGVPHYSPHRLRHGFATRLRQRHVPLDTIQKLLGHSRSDTTERYFDELKADLVEHELAVALPELYENDATEEAASERGSTVGSEYAFRPGDDVGPGETKPPAEDTQ